MVLQCSGQAGDAFADDGDILGKIRDGDSLDTLIRTADEHGLRCEWAGAGGEREQPGLAAAKPEVEKAAEVHLRWASGSRASQSFAVLHRLDYNVWDGWLRPARLAGQGAGQVPPVRLTRNGVGYEMALAAVFRAMGEAMPEEFAVAYLTDQPKPAPDPEPPGLPAGQLAPAEAWLPMSYARYLIRRAEWFSSGMALACSGRTGGVFSDNQTILAEIQDGIRRGRRWRRWGIRRYRRTCGSGRRA